MKGKKSKIDPAHVEETTQQIGRSLWQQRQRRNPSIFEKRWWDDRIMSWAMLDESVKVQMFRFVDVLPMLKSHESVNRHLHEYFEEVRSHLPWAVRIGLDVTEPDTILSRSLAINARANALRMAKRFIAGESVSEVHSAISGLRRQGMAFTLDLLGEAVINEDEAERYQASYLNLLSGLAPLVGDWAENIILDRDDRGPIPRLNASIKLSALVSHFNPHDPTGTATEVKHRLRPILTAARELDAYIHVDMENYAVKDLTIEIFQQILMEPDFRDFHDVGIVIQAYQPEAEQDLVRLRDWAKKRGTPIWIRLVKGAYWDYETVIAAQRGWPVPVYLQKWESDANYERLTEFLLRNADWLRPAFASHNLRSLSHALAWAKILELPKNAFELQMLYGMAGDQAELFAETGHRIRIYTPFGELIPGMAYLVRRLLENTSNDSFLRASLRTGVDLDSLLMNPLEIGKMKPALPPIEHTGFHNEPWTDFSREENRESMLEALDDVRNELGEEYAIVIQNRRIDTKKKLTSRNPSNKKEIVGKVSSAGKSEALQAIDAARSAFREWSITEVNYRAEYLELIAAELRRRKFELSAWEVLECGKPWLEADADVAEAIDFCMYYAQEMRRLDHPR
ncbi:MAG: proline dehydrogenase family protein, partial [Planctomycetaceae bacterium]|nr:proline dehydrogenase family protein [Planctomycetaceae bacterium]